MKYLPTALALLAAIAAVFSTQSELFLGAHPQIVTICAFIVAAINLFIKSPTA